MHDTLINCQIKSAILAILIVEDHAQRLKGNIETHLKLNIYT